MRGSGGGLSSEGVQKLLAGIVEYVKRAALILGIVFRNYFLKLPLSKQDLLIR